MDFALIKWQSYRGAMEVLVLLLLIVAVLVALDMLAPVEGPDLRDWEDPRH